MTSADTQGTGRKRRTERAGRTPDDPDAAEINTLVLDDLFDRLERMPTPEGYRTEIVEGTIFMTPHLSEHWAVIAGVIDQLRVMYPRKRIMSDVRFDFPGDLNGFAPDLVLLTEEAADRRDDHWLPEHAECVVEVILPPTARNDYHPKKHAYAAAGLPLYVIVDPYTARAHAYTDPEDGDYQTELTVAFGKPLDLTGTVLGLALETDEFPREDTRRREDTGQR